MKYKLCLEGNITLEGLKSTPKVFNSKIFSVHARSINQEFIDLFNKALISKKNDLLKNGKYDKYKIKTLKLDNQNFIYTAKLILKKDNNSTTYNYYVSDGMDGNIYIGCFTNSLYVINTALSIDLFYYLTIIACKNIKYSNLMSNTFSFSVNTLNESDFNIKRDNEIDKELKDISNMKYRTIESYQKIEDINITKICKIKENNEVFHTLLYTDICKDTVLYAALEHTYDYNKFYLDWEAAFITICKQYNSK